MMNTKFFLILLFSLTFGGCKAQGVPDNVLSTIEPVQIRRFDKSFFQLLETNDTTLRYRIEKDYPQILDIIGKGVLNMQSSENPDFMDKALAYYSEPTLKELYRNSVQRYDSINDIQRSLGEGFAYLRDQFPGMQMPAVYMHVSGLNQNVLTGDSLLSISIDKYLGADYPFYKDFFYDYELRKMERSFVVPDYLAGWLMSVYPFEGKTNVLLDRMIYEGKIRYLIAEALSCEADMPRLIGYTEAEAEWCGKHEKEIWKYIVGHKQLYTPDQITTDKYFSGIPSAFLSNEAPGFLGVWIGYRIVRRFMEENKLAPADLMGNNDSQTILEASMYRP